MFKGQNWLKSVKNGHFWGDFCVFEVKLDDFGLIFSVFWANLRLAAEGDTADRVSEVPVVAVRGENGARIEGQVVCIMIIVADG